MLEKKLIESSLTQPAKFSLFSRPGALAASPLDSAPASALPAPYAECSAQNPAARCAPWRTW